MLSDLLYAARSLRRAPGFTAAAALTLALGVGANTTIFSVVHAVLLQPLAFATPETLVSLREGTPERRLNISYPNFLDWRERNALFADMAICLPVGSAVMTGADRPIVVPTARTEGRLFRLLGVPLAAGRTFTADEERPGAPPVAVISHALAVRTFNAPERAIGAALMLDGAPVTVVGVAAPEFRLLTADVLFPLGTRIRPMDLDRGNHPGFFAYARLKDGVDVERAQREMSAIAVDLERQYPQTNTGMGVIVVPMTDALLGGARPILLLLGCAVALLLLIACANVANVLLARGLHRARDTAVRSALGAARWRLVRLHVAEGLVIALLGSGAAVLLASWGVRALRAMQLSLPRAADIGVTAPVIVYAGAVGLLTVVVFALAPALQLTRVDLMTILRQSGNAQGTRTTGRLRTLLVVFEVALSLVLVVGAGLMVRTIARLVAVSPGYDAEAVMSAQISQPGDRYQDEERIRQFGDRVIADVRALPGVADAALAFAPGPFWTPRVVVPSRPAAPGQEPAPFASAVTPGFFATMGIPLKHGRLLDSRDRPGAPVAAVVSETFVRQVLGGADPLGQRLHAIGIPQMAAMEIVGVVGDTRRLGLGVAPDPELYVSYAQMTVSDPTLIVRASAGDPLTLARAIDERIASVDPDVPRIRPRRLSDELSGSIRNRRAIMSLLGLFAIVALGLTALGIGGVVSYSVAQRTPEIGVRIALGAEPGAVQRLIVANALLPVAAGVGFGALATLPFSRLIQSFLYNLTPLDPVSILVGTGVLLLAAVTAAWIPARRATRIDPLVALRSY